ncbi:MAG: hypothetical protein DYG89_16310 [Caldilinea sp. CFX5]|nr:hypothetical protein [Caldilinea sp. CFX5]
MNEILTPERVMEIGEEWKRILIHHTPDAEMKKLLSPELKQELIEQGANQKTRDIVLAMHAKGFDLAVMADINGFAVTQV